jgi:hypothetical protein
MDEHATYSLRLINDPEGNINAFFAFCLLKVKHNAPYDAKYCDGVSQQGWDGKC